MNKSSEANSVSIVSDDNAALTTVTNYSILSGQSKPPKVEWSKGSTNPKGERLNEKQHMFVLNPDVAELLAKRLSVKLIGHRLNKVNAERFYQNVVHDHNYSKANSPSPVSDDNVASETVTNYIIAPSQSKHATGASFDGSTSQTGGNPNEEQHMYVLDPDVAELLAEGLSVRYICKKLRKVHADRFYKNVVFDHERGVIDAQLRVRARTLLGEVRYGSGANDAPTPGNTSQTNETINARKRKAKKIVTSLGVMNPSYYLKQKEWLGDITYTCKECHNIFSKDVNYLYLLHLLGHLQFLVSIEEIEDNNRHLLQRIMKDGNIVKYLELHGLEMHQFYVFNEGGNSAVVSDPVKKETKKNNLTSSAVVESVNIENYIIKAPSNKPANNLKTTEDIENTESDCFQTFKPSLSNKSTNYLKGTNDDGIRITDSEYKPLRCFKCKKEFINNFFLNAHNKFKHPVSSKCDVCPKRCATDYNLKQLVNKLKEINCENCKRKFVSDENLKMHMETHSIGTVSIKLFNSTQCTKQFRGPTDLDIHVADMHSTGKDWLLGCLFCDKQFKTKSDWNTHTTVVHARDSTLVHTQSKSFTCKQCKNNFISGKHLKNHLETNPTETVFVKLLKVHMGTEKFRDQPDLDMHVEDMQSTGKEKHWLLSCPHCDEKFKTKSVRKKHIKGAHAKQICPTCGKMNKGRRNLYYHRRHEHNEGRGFNKDYDHFVQKEKYKCKFCLRCFRRSFILRNHENRHVCEDGHFQCLICWDTFVEKEQLMAHMTSEHSDNRKEKTKCHMCKRSFTTRKSLKMHRTIVHSKNESLRCLQCHKEFSSHIVLKSHINLRHPCSVKCNVCHKICATVLHLKRHKLLHTQRKKFRFVKCKKKFISEENLNTHLETHSNETASVKLLNFPHCVKQFLEEPALDMHVTKVHSLITYEDAPFSCTYCDYKCGDKPALERHVSKVHSLIKYEDTPFSCTYCDYKCGDKPALETHISKVHSLIKYEDTPFSCTYCDYKCGDKPALETHVTKVHSKIKYKDGMLSCIYCEKEFKTKSSRNRHIRTLHNKTCPTCGKLCSNLYCHIRDEHNADNEHAMQKYKCQFCLKYFGNNVVLKAHEKKHWKDGSFTCSTCGKVYSNQPNLYRHIRDEHNTDNECVMEEGKYKCQFCLRCFGKYFILKTHMKKHLCEDGRFNCLMCGFTFAEKEHLVAHVTSEHSDLINLSCIEYKKQMSKQRTRKQSPCQCDHCGVVVTNRPSLRRHIQRLHSSDNTEAESSCFTCKECGKSYAANHRLKKHIYHVHTPRNFCVCHICGKKLTCKQMLTKHMVMHDEPQHECGICKKKFRRSYYLKYHQQMHSSVKQLFCPICSKRCAFATGLKYHMKTHHKTIKE